MIEDGSEVPSSHSCLDFRLLEYPGLGCASGPTRLIDASASFSVRSTSLLEGETHKESNVHTVDRQLFDWTLADLSSSVILSHCYGYPAAPGITRKTKVLCVRCSLRPIARQPPTLVLHH